MPLLLRELYLKRDIPMKIRHIPKSNLFPSNMKSSHCVRLRVWSGRYRGSAKAEGLGAVVLELDGCCCWWLTVAAWAVRWTLWWPSRRKGVGQMGTRQGCCRGCRVMAGQVVWPGEKLGQHAADLGEALAGQVGAATWREGNLTATRGARPWRRSIRRRGVHYTRRRKKGSGCVPPLSPRKSDGRCRGCGKNGG